MVIILELSHPIVWFVRHVCSDKAEFFFLKKKTAFWCSLQSLIPFHQERYQRPVLLFVTEPIKRILNSHNVKVAQKPFQTLGHIFAKPKDPVTKEQRTDAIYSIPCNDCNNEYTFENAILFCKKENSVLSEHTCLTNHTIGWGKSKTITSNRRAPLFGTLTYWLRPRSSPPDEGTRQECRKVGSVNCNLIGCIH